jgi:hypothetical protein
VNPEIAARLQKLDITWSATEKGYTFFTRGQCAAIAHGLSLGSSGLMTETGLAYLVWREDRPFLAGHGGGETAATPEQVETVRRFSADLKTVLEDAPGS